jgi:hypothetical protein
MEADEPQQSVDNPHPPGSDEDGAASGTDAMAGLKGTRSLRRLRDRVERVAHELRMLREENATLQELIAELESMPADAGVGGVRLLESDPDALKRKVVGFIEAIDRYLDEKEPTR